MQEFLQSEIQKAKQLSSSKLFLQINKQDIMRRYKQLTKIYLQDQDQRINNQLQLQQEIDKLSQQKTIFNQSLKQLRQKLKLVHLDKQELLKKCELKEQLINQYKSIENRLKSKDISHTEQKYTIVKNIKENQILNLKFCVLNQYFTEQMSIGFIIIGVAKNIKQNCKINQNLIHSQQIGNKNIQILQYYKKTAQNSIDNPKLRILQLERSIKLQNIQNELIRQKIESSKYIESNLTMKCQFLRKIISFRQKIVQNNDNFCQQEELKNLTIKNITLKEKLQNFRQLNRQMININDVLKGKIQICRQLDIKSIDKMNVSSNRLQKGLNNRRYILKERYNLIDQYKKYLLDHHY